MGSSGKIVRIEEVLVGVFGAFIGGDFLMSQINGPVAATTTAAAAAPTGFSGASLGLAVLGAGVMLVLLKMMRGVVGPMRNSKSRLKQR